MVHRSKNTTVAGTPTYTVDVGGASKAASYVSGSGTETLVFSYTVTSGDADAAGGVTAAADALALSGGTLTDAAGNNADVSVSAVAASSNSITVDTAAPTVNSVVISGAESDGTTANSNTLVAGDKILVTVTMSEDTTVAGAPTYTVDVGGASKAASYVSGSGGDTLVFSYTVTSGDADAGGGVTAAADALALSGGTLTDAAGNAADVSVSAVAASSNTVTVDGIAPTVSSVDISGAESDGTTANSNTLVAGDKILVTVAMSEDTIVAGTPTYTVDVGGASKAASYVSGSGTDTLVFSYTVTSGDADAAGGVTANANALALSGGTLTDAAGNNADVSVSAVAASSNSVTVDTIAPTVSDIELGVDGNVAITSAGTGQVVQVYLGVSADTDLSALSSATTPPSLALTFADSGSGTAVYNHAKSVASSTSGSVWLVFDYVLTNNDSGALSVAALTPGDAADSAGNALIATLPTLTDSLTAAGALSVSALQGDGNANADTVLNASELSNGGDVVISGVSANGASVTVAVGDVSVTVTADGSGAWEATLSGLTDGDKVASVTTGSQSLEYNFSIDRSASIVITSVNTGDPAAGHVIGALAAVPISGTTTSIEAGRTVAISVTDGTGTTNGSAVVQADGSWSTTIDLSSYADGDSLTFTTSTSDEAGNSATASTTHSIDAVAPNLQSAIYDATSGSERYIVTFDDEVYGTWLDSAFTLSDDAGTISSVYVNTADRTQVIIELSASPTTNLVTINVTDASALTDLAGNPVIGTDSDGTTGPDVSIDLSVPNVLINGVLGINSGETVTITEAIFSASAFGADALNLIFTASAVAGGQFELTDNLGVEVTNFTLADIQAGKVVFVDDGSGTAPAFDLDVAVAGGASSAASVAADVRYGELPAVQLAAHYNGRDPDGDGDITEHTAGGAVTKITDSDNTYLEILHTTDHVAAGVTYEDKDDGINGHAALDFTNATKGFGANATNLERYSANKRVWGGVFQTGNDVKTTQVIYEEGGSVNGYSIIISGGHLIMSMYNGVMDQTRVLDLGLVNANTVYSFVNHYDQADKIFRGYINGVLTAELEVTFVFKGHNDTYALGAAVGSTAFYDPDTGQANKIFVNNSNIFKGLLGEIFAWAKGDVSDAQIASINNYLINRWDIETAPIITIADDVIPIADGGSHSGIVNNALSRTIALNPLDAAGVGLVKNVDSARVADGDSTQIQSLTIDVTDQQVGDGLRIGSTEIDLSTEGTIDFDFTGQSWQAQVDDNGKVVFSTQSGRAAADTEMESLLEAIVYYTHSADNTDRSVTLFVTDADGNSSNAATVNLMVASADTVVGGFSTGADSVVIHGLGFSVADGLAGYDILSISAAGDIGLDATNGVQDLQNIERLDVANGQQNDLTLSDLFVTDVNTADGLQIDLDSMDTLMLSVSTGSWVADASANTFGYDAYTYTNGIDSSDDYTLYVTTGHSVLGI